MTHKLFWKVPAMILLGIAAFIGLGMLLMTLWNHLIPVLFHGPVITFWQGVGLFILAKILFHSGSHARSWNRGKYYYWRSRMHERMAAMSPEEREKLKEEWSQCARGHWHSRYSRTEKPGDTEKE